MILLLMIYGFSRSHLSPLPPISIASDSKNGQEWFSATSGECSIHLESSEMLYCCMPRTRSFMNSALDWVAVPEQAFLIGYDHWPFDQIVGEVIHTADF